MRKRIVPFIVALSLVALPAHADRGYGRGGGHGHGHGHRGGGGDGAVWAGLAVIGALAGLAIMAERSRPAEPVYSALPVYPAQAPAAPENWWYYCQSSAMYYPYANACPEGWQAVPANPY